MTELTESPMFAPTSPDYDRLPAADKSLIDRAIFDHVVTQQGNNFTFAASETRLHGGRAPNSQQVEWDIVALREMHADRLLGGGAAARQQLTREAQGAPANATAMLNAINAFNGDECGCSVVARPAEVNLNRVLAPVSGARR